MCLRGLIFLPAGIYTETGGLSLSPLHFVSISFFNHAHTSSMIFHFPPAAERYFGVCVYVAFSTQENISATHKLFLTINRIHNKKKKKTSRATAEQKQSGKQRSAESDDGVWECAITLRAIETNKN